jgi:hypothetical protein
MPRRQQRHVIAAGIVVRRLNNNNGEARLPNCDPREATSAASLGYCS